MGNGVRVVLDLVAGNGYILESTAVGRKIWKKKIEGKVRVFARFVGFVVILRP